MINGPTWSQKLRNEIGQAVIGQDVVIERLLVALLANGHVLTTHKGPIFANLVLADEINRAPAKVQSALLEAMQERQVTIGGTSHILPKPFFVMATQNPVEQEGTYPLPEAQTDRFLFKLLVDYPTASEESLMMERWGQVTKQPALKPVSSGEELLSLRTQVDAIHVSPAVQAYILSLVRSSRELAAQAEGTGNARRLLNFGASPRASLALFQASRALAWLRGGDYVSPALIQEVFHDALRHRVGLTYEAEAEGLTSDKVLDQVLIRTPVPAQV
jgi:MoxR-like ATPase